MFRLIVELSRLPARLSPPSPPARISFFFLPLIYTSGIRINKGNRYKRSLIRGTLGKKEEEKRNKEFERTYRGVVYTVVSILIIFLSCQQLYVLYIYILLDLIKIGEKNFEPI